MKVIAKLGYEVDQGSGREHLWFGVHACHDDRLDATLLSSPFAVAHLKQGRRGEHPAERLTDWMVMTPAGQITHATRAPRACFAPPGGSNGGGPARLTRG